MKQLIIFPTGSIHKDDLQRLSRNGVLAIECAEPTKVLCIFPELQQLKADGLLQAALSAMAGTTSTEERRRFGEGVIKLLTTPKAQEPLK